MTPDELTDDAIDYIIVHVGDAMLSKGEQGFVESVTDQWERRRWLSDRQKEVLGNIWDRQP